MVKMVKTREQTTISKRRRSGEFILGGSSSRHLNTDSRCRLLLTYSLTCQSELSKSQKEFLKSWIQTEKSKRGEKELLEKWSISREEYVSFVGKLL